MTAKPLLRLLILLALGAATLPAPTAAEEKVAAAKGGQSALRYVRVLVPTAQVRLEECRDKRIKYWPVDPQELEQLLARAETTGQADRAPGAAVVSARYEARLDADTLVDGEGWLDVIYTAEGRGMLPLDPCGLAIGEASWTSESEQGCQLGLGPDGKLAAVVERAGRLHLGWSLRGHRDATGAVLFEWQAPPSPSSSLVLRLPAQMTPLAEQAVVVDEGLETEAVRRWRIEMGGPRRLAIRVVPTRDSDQQLPSTRVRQSTVYGCTLRGLDVRVDLELDVYGEPLRYVALRLDPGLRPVKALYGETPLVWTWNPLESGDGGTRLGLEFPEPIRGPARIVRLQLLAPIELNGRWRLPSVRPEGTFWEEGEATLSVSPPLLLEELVPIEGRQRSKIEPLPAPSSGETVRVQYFAADAGVEIVLTRPEAPLQLEGGTTIEFSGGEVIGQIGVVGWVTLGKRFQIEADIASPWEIDSVETVPADLLADWSVAEEETGSRLTIQLAKPLVPLAAEARPSRLRIGARRGQLAVGGALGIAELVPLRFRGAVEGRRLLCLRAREPYELRLTGGQTVTRVDPRTLPPDLLTLLSPKPDSVLFEQDAAAAGLRVSLRARRPSYSATIRVEAAVSEHSLTESYWLRCVPEAGRRVDRVLVHLSGSRPEPLRWTLGTEDSDHWTVRRLRGAGQSEADTASDAERWEIRLHPPRSVPFELRASRAKPLTGHEAVSLAAVPEAKHQQATVAVRSSGAAAVEIEADRLQPIPPTVAPADPFGSLQGTFRYDPVQDAAGQAEPALTISRLEPKDVPPSVWAWSLRLESQYEVSGTARHLAAYQIESNGGERVRVTLPPGATRPDLRGVWIDGEPVTSRPAGDKSPAGLDVALVPGKRFAVLSICFATAGPPLGLVHSIDSPLPEIDVPVLAGEWTVWLPPDYQADQERLAGQARGGQPTSWAQRLFGPLGRRPDSGPFDPFSPRDWKQMMDDEPLRGEAESRAAALVEWLRERTAQHRLRQETDPLDWGSLLGEASSQPLLAGAGGRTARLQLLVDRLALTRDGLTPATPVRLPVGETPGGRGGGPLDQEALTLLVHADALVVTTALDAALSHAQLRPGTSEDPNSPEGGPLWWVRPGPLGDRIARAAAGSPDDALVPVRLWRRQPASSPLPWSEEHSRGLEPVDARGRNAYRLEIPDRSPVRLSVVHRDRLRAAPWIAFLAVIGLVWWTAIRRPATLIAALGVFGTAALLLPESYAPIGAGAVLGTLFVVGAWLIRPNGEPGAHQGGSAPRSESSSTRKAPTAWGILLVAQTALLVLSGSSRGEEAKPAPLPAWWPAHGLLIPVDDQMQPTGEKCQVPLDFYNQLLQRAGAASADRQGWLLGPATYHGKLLWEPASGRLVLGELKGTFDLEVLSPSARVIIPFGDAGPDLSPDGALLDGQPIQPQLGNNSLELEVAERGPHRLEFSFRSAARTEETSSGVDVPIPRLATSRLELTVPPDAPAIEVLSAVGRTGSEPLGDSRHVSAELGPADRLSLRWARDAGSGGAGRTVDVEELLWLKVEPESVVVNARYVLSVVGGAVDELRLTVDPRLRLRPMEGVEIDATPGSPQTIRLRLSQPVAERKTLDATFVVPEASGIGNVRMPHLQVVGVRTPRRWMAVSVHASLEAEEHVPEAMESVAVPEFVAAWGEVAVQPRSAYRLASGEPLWSITTRPLEPEVTADQTQAWTFASGEAFVQFEARLAATGGYRFQHRLSAPPALEIQSASVLEADMERVDRWRAAPDGTVTVFLKRGTAGEQKLSLRGRLTIPERGKLDLPTVRMEGANVQSSRIQIFRKPEVLVEMSQKTPGLVEDPEPLVDADRASLGRLVKSFAEDGSGRASATLAISPNRPQVHGEQLTLLRCDGDAWEAETSFRLLVDRGVLDEIRLNMPVSCRGPFGIDPPATWQEEQTADQRQLVIRPDPAISGEYRLTVTSPLDFPPGQPVSVPEIAIAQGELESRLLALPTQAGLRPVVWQTRGLRVAELPDVFSVPLVAPEAIAVYRVEEEPFGAVLRPVSGEPALHLADVRLDWQADGTCRGLAVFDLEPAGQSACSLQLPPGCRLVQVAVAGTPSLAVRSGDNRWRVPLSGPPFPQRIEVLFQGETPPPDASGAVRFDAPTLAGLPARRTLWTVTGPPVYGPGRPERLRPVSPLEQEIIRFESTEAMIKAGVKPTAETAEDMDRWCDRWAQRWMASCREVEHQRTLSRPTEAVAVQADQLPVDRLPERVAERFRRGDLPGTVSAGSPEAAGLLPLWLRSVARPAPATRCLADQQAMSLTLGYRRVEERGLVHRWAGAAGWVSLVLLTLLGFRWGVFAAWMRRWPCLLGVVAGLAWWLWLWPSILGWGIVLASLAGSFRWGWTRPRGGGSAIVTLTLGKQ